MPLSKSDERRSRSSKGDERLSKMGGSLVFKMGGSWAQRASATEPETGLTSVQKMRAAQAAAAYEAAVATAVRGAAEEKPTAPPPGGASLEA